MTEIWFKKPAELLNNLDQIFPNNNLNYNQKVNSLIRLSLYISIIIYLLNFDSKLLIFPLTIILGSYFYNDIEPFVEIKKEEQVEMCQRPTKNNPFMNFTVGDLIDNPHRPKACSYEKSKEDIRREFKSNLHTDINDIWGKNISDRNFYTMPNTNLVNDQMEFARWKLGISGNCKTNGEDCLKQRDPTYHRGRIETL